MLNMDDVRVMKAKLLQSEAENQKLKEQLHGLISLVKKWVEKQLNIKGALLISICFTSSLLKLYQTWSVTSICLLTCHLPLHPFSPSYLPSPVQSHSPCHLSYPLLNSLSPPSNPLTIFPLCLGDPAHFPPLILYTLTFYLPDTLSFTLISLYLLT